MDGANWGMIVPTGPACAQTEHSTVCNCRSGNFHLCKFCSKLRKIIKKKKKRGGEEEEEEKENTVQTLLWPNLALLRKENFPEPHLTNLEA